MGEKRRQVYLAPGFFGFSRLGGLNYFQSVGKVLREALSQIHGRVIDIVVADHLDIAGQFKRDDLPHGDWLPSGSHFDWACFEKAWDGVAREIMDASGG